MSAYDAFKREILNLPNMITIGRLFLIPHVIWLIEAPLNHGNTSKGRNNSSSPINSQKP